MDFSTDEELSIILSDHLSGSQTLLSELNAYLRSKALLASLQSDLIHYIKNKTLPFQNIQNYLEELERILLTEPEILLSFLSSYDKIEYGKYHIIADKLKTKIPHSFVVITLSNSKTVLEVLRILKSEGFVFEVVVSESRPLNEGKIIATELANIDIGVTYITEAMLPDHLGKCDFVLIGADALLPDGNVVNKTGSKLLAMLCEIFNKNFYVLTDKYKKRSEESYIQKFGHVGEIWDTDHNFISITNPYFEVVEKRLISDIITD